MSFLDMIGPSDIAYIVTVLKNSKATWLHNPADTTTTMPKPIFTMGESKKRVFGNSTMSDEGYAFFKEGVKNWKKVYDPTSLGFTHLKTEWENWLQEEGSAGNNGCWRRKNIRSLLETRVQVHQHGNDICRENEDDGEDGGSVVPNIIQCEYDSDGDLGQVGRKRRAHDNDDESISMGGEDDTVARGHGAVRGAIEDDNDDDDEEEEEEGGGRTWSPGMVTTQRIMMRVMMRT